MSVLPNPKCQFYKIQNVSFTKSKMSVKTWMKKDAKEKDDMNRFIHFFISLLWLIGSMQDLEPGRHYCRAKNIIPISVCEIRMVHAFEGCRSADRCVKPHVSKRHHYSHSRGSQDQSKMLFPCKKIFFFNKVVTISVMAKNGSQKGQKRPKIRPNQGTNLTKLANFNEIRAHVM